MRSRLKLLVLAPAYFPSNGGVERHIRAVVSVLKKQRVDVTIAVRYKSSYPKSQIVDGVKVLRMPKRDNRIAWQYWSRVNGRLLNHIDVVHSHDVFPFTLRQINKEKRWIHTFHGYEGYPVEKSAIISRQAVAKSADYTFGIGAFIEKWYGTKCDEVLYGASNQELGHKLKEEWDVVYYGRLEEDTGFREYLKGFALASKNNPDLSLVVLGDGSLMSWARGFAEEHGLKVDFEGMVESVFDYLASSKIAYVSGYLGIIEAGVHELPIIAQYNSPIKKDYLELHPMAKYMHIVSDPESIAQATRNANNENSIRLKQVKKWATGQTWQNVADKYRTAYQAD